MILEIIQNNIWFSIAAVAGAYLIEPTYSIGYIVFTLVSLSLLIYWLHRWTHHNQNWFTELHVKYHHQHVQTPLTILNEIIFDFMGAGGFVALFSILFGLQRWISPYLAIYFGLIYMFIHMYTNTYFRDSEQHLLHHAHQKYNFSPDVFDHIFQTSFDNSVEDNNQNIPLAILATSITLVCKYYAEQ